MTARARSRPRNAAADLLGESVSLLPAALLGDGRPEQGMKRVLFLCGGNSARSILAEALLNARDDPGWHAWSAGIEPKGVHPLTLVTLRQAGISVAGLRSKAVQEFLGESFDVIITLCQPAKGNCPFFPGPGLRLHWHLEDPAEATGSEAERLAVFRRVGDELDQRIERLVSEGISR